MYLARFFRVRGVDRVAQVVFDRSTRKPGARRAAIALDRLAGSSSIALIVHSNDNVPAASVQGRAASSILRSILKSLAEDRSPARDCRLYQAAVDLFYAIEAGTEPHQSRQVMATAFHVVAVGQHANAWIDYGRCLWNGWGVRQDRDQALVAYKNAAELGSNDGAYHAAFSLYCSCKNDEEAHAWAIKALQGDDTDGAVRYLLGLMAYHGRGRAKDITESLRLHHEAAKRGNADALFELFLFAVHGIGDEKRAIYYLKEAAMRDQPRACANLGALYAIGASQALSASKGQTDKIDRDLSEAIKWYTRAADLGAGEAAASLGVMALRGEGMPNDPKVAKEFLRRAEELGFDVDAFLRLSGLDRP